MASALARLLLVSAAALSGLAAMPVAGAFAPAGGHALSSAAFADDDDDDCDDDDDDDRWAGREVVLDVTPEQVAGLRDGSLVAVDNLGRRLEIDIDRECGRRIVTGEVRGRDWRGRPGRIESVDFLSRDEWRRERP